MYRLYISKHEMKTIGFRYDYILKDYVYEFPVYKYGRKPVVTCKLGIDSDNFEVWFSVYDSKGTIYAPYYDREFHKNNLVVEIVEKNIRKEFKKLGVVQEREW